MNRNVVFTMDEIFDRLIEYVTDDNRDRIANDTKRHIKAIGDEAAVIDVVKKAIILSEDPNIPICGVRYQEKNYLVVERIYAEHLEAIGMNVLAEENNQELFQGLGMLAIAYKYLPLKKGLATAEIIDECLAFDRPDEEFLFDDISRFFEGYSVFLVEKGIFNLEYIEDLHRLHVISLSETSAHFNDAAQCDLKKLLLLDGTRSVAATILNSLASEQWEYAYLQMYQCLEYLFSVQNAVWLKQEYGADLYIAIDIASASILKKSEKDSLLGVLSNADELQKQQFIRSIFKSEADDGDPNEKIAKLIYNIRCNVAHLRFNQDRVQYPADRATIMQEFVSLILNIFQNVDSVIKDVCLHKSTWKPLRDG